MDVSGFCRVSFNFRALWCILTYETASRLKEFKRLNTISQINNVLSIQINIDLLIYGYIFFG